MTASNIDDRRSQLKGTKTQDLVRMQLTNTRSMRFILRSSENNHYNYDISTEDNHRSTEMRFYGNYAHIRKTLDYTYHSNYTEARQRLQNSIIDDMMKAALITDKNGDMCTTPTEPWLVFTAGAMGAGKSYTIKCLVEKERFPLLAFVSVDPDEIRRLFPEYDLYTAKNPLLAGELTRKEAGFVAEILTAAALQKGKNVLVDGSLRDSDWYQKYFAQLRSEYSSLKIGILHVTAPREAVMRRAQERGLLTRRMIPKEILEMAIEQVPKSVAILSPLTDYFCEVHNAHGADIEIVTEGETWESFQDQWLQTCAWVPGRREKIMDELKTSLHIDTLKYDRPRRKDSVSSDEKSVEPKRRSLALKDFKTASKRAFLLCPQRTSSFHAVYKSGSSTEDNYKSDEMKFFGSFIQIRKSLDYTYHSNYCKKRQWLQDSVIEDMLEADEGIDVNGNIGDTPSKPWIVFTAGARGAGKRYTFDHLLKTDRFPIVGFIVIDPDEIRSNLPEYMIYLHEHSHQASDLTRREVGYITEILALAALQSGKNIIFDGALRNIEWYKKFMTRIRDEFCEYRIAIIHVSAPRDCIHKRVEEHSKLTGRVIPREMIDTALQHLPRACKILKPHVDYFCELYNPPDGEVQILTDGIDWNSFRENWLQTVATHKRDSSPLFIPRR